MWEQKSEWRKRKETREFWDGVILTALAGTYSAIVFVGVMFGFHVY